MNTKLHFRVGVYEAGHEDEPKFCGPVFRPCRLDVAAMHSAIERFKAKDPQLRIGVFIQEDAPEPIEEAADLSACGVTP